MPAPSNIDVTAVPNRGEDGDVIVVAVAADGEEPLTLSGVATNVAGTLSADVVITTKGITYTLVMPSGWTAVERPDEPGVFDVTIG